jgi:hypothetical protein
VRFYAQGRIVLLFQERHDERCSEFLEPLEAIPRHKRVYVEETGFDAPLVREYAYGNVGETCMGERTGKRFARTSLMAGLKGGGKPLAPMA